MHQRFSLTNISNSNLLYISETKLDGDFKTTLHSHPNLEILFIYEGEGILVTNKKRINFKKGDIVIINANSEHYESSKKCSFFAIGINNTDFFLEETYNKKIINFFISNENYSSILNIYQTIYTEIRNHLDNYDKIILNCYSNLLLFIAREKKFQLLKSDTSKLSYIVASTKNILDNYFYRDISLQKLSKRLSISVSTLCHNFKEEMGMTIIDYKLNCQINEAKNLLKISDMSIVQIALSTGFNSPSYFTKIFKIKTGMTPSQYQSKL